MEDVRDTGPDELSESTLAEIGEAQLLDYITFQAEEIIERRGNVQEAEAVEATFVNLVDQMEENLENLAHSKEGEEDEEYLVKVKFPWLSPGEDEDFEAVWARVGSLMTDERGTWFMPETSDSVVMDSDQEITHPKDFQPLGDIELQEKNMEIEPVNAGIDERQYDSQGNIVENKEKKYDLGEEGIIGEPKEDFGLDLNSVDSPRNLEFDSRGSVVSSQTKSFDIEEGDEPQGYGIKLDSDNESAIPQRKMNESSDNLLGDLEINDKDIPKSDKVLLPDDLDDSSEEGGRGSDDESGNDDKKDDG